VLTWSTDAGHPGRPNEDFVGAVPTAVVLVDGAGITGAEDLCRHGTAWYAHRLGTTLLARLSLDAAGGSGSDLTEVLAAAIDEVTDLHRDTCRVEDPSSPCATVAMVRLVDERVEHLLLGDSVVVLDALEGPPQVVEDRREPDTARPFLAALRGLEPGTPEHEAVLDEARGVFRSSRNQPGGFWVAKDDGPAAAAEALTGSRELVELRGAVLLSNGASRVVDRFALLEWAQLFAQDPDELIRLVRAAELEHDVEADDATAARWGWATG
jgi:hypothetical protein